MKKWLIAGGIILLVIIGLLLAVGYYAGTRSLISTDVSNIRQIGILIYHYHEKTGTYPNTLQEISEDPEIRNDVREMMLSSDLQYYPPKIRGPPFDEVLLRYKIKGLGSVCYTYGNSAFYEKSR